MADSGVETGNDSDTSITFDSIRFALPAVPGEAALPEWHGTPGSPARHKLKARPGPGREARLSPYAGALHASKNRKLRFAASTNNPELVERLLDAGADPDAADERGRRPLHVAACRGYGDVIAALVRRGADPNGRDSLGNTPLHLAACTRHVPAVLALLDGGTDAAQPDRRGRSALQLAQSKLRLVQLRPPGGAAPESDRLCAEVAQVVRLMLRVMPERDAQLQRLLDGLRGLDLREADQSATEEAQL